MKTYVEVIISTEGEKASVITDIFFEMGFASLNNAPNFLAILLLQQFNFRNMFKD